ALVLVTGVIGSWLAKREGMIAWQRFHSVASQGKIPSREIQDGLMIVFAGALLLTPGLITDAVGFWLLLPFGRQLVRKYFLAGRVRGFSNVKFYASASASQAAEPLHPSFDDSRTVEGRVSSGGRSGRSVEG
ncbi:MAG: FxsA family protein, partial [Planctomycetota bacterium]